MKALASVFILVFSILPTFAQQEREVKAFLNEVYEEVTEAYNNRTGTDAITVKYCSTVFKELYREVLRKEKSYGLLREDDNDVWHRVSDYYDNGSFTIAEVKKIEGKDVYLAWVDALFTCTEYYGPTKFRYAVYVIPEKGSWKVDDFKYEHDAASDATEMRQNLANATKTFANPDSATIAYSLSKIYKEVVRQANSEKCNTSILTQICCSKKFKKLYNEVTYWEKKFGEMIAGTDCWIRVQDWDKLGEFEISNIKITSPSTAVADVTTTYIMLTTTGEESYKGKTLLNLICENGEWVIDDFTSYNGNGEPYTESDSDWYKKGIREAEERWSESIEKGDIWWKENNQ